MSILTGHKLTLRFTLLVTGQTFKNIKYAYLYVYMCIYIYLIHVCTCKYSWPPFPEKMLMEVGFELGISEGV